MNTIPCDNCEKPVATNSTGGGHGILCPKCRKEHKRLNSNYANEGRHYQRVEMLPRAVKIIHDPDQEFGFFRNARFGEEDHRNMLRMACYTPGTILADSKGRLFKVVPQARHQTLVPINNEQTNQDGRQPS